MASINLILLFDALAVLSLMSIVIITTMHFGLMFQTLTLSANSIARERQTNNWKMLILTGMDARKIVRGKWWATALRMWRSYGRLALLRAMLIGWFGAYYNRGYVVSSTHYLYGGSPANMVIPTIPHFLLVAFFVVALTMANLLFTAACGVTAFNKHGGMGRARAVATRLLVGLTFGGIAIFTNWFISKGIAETFFQPVILPVFLTLFDNGIGLGSEVVSYHFNNSYFTDGSMYWLPIFLISLGVYALLTVLMLRFAQWQAVRQGALPPLTRKTSKTAYNT